MSKIQTILRPAVDGSIHLPVPPELRNSSELRVVAWIEPAGEHRQNKSQSGPGQWALHARGLAEPFPGETSDDARLAAMRDKFDVR